MKLIQSTPLSRTRRCDSGRSGIVATIRGAVTFIRPTLIATALLGGAVPTHAQQQPVPAQDTPELQKLIEAAKAEKSLMVYHTSAVATIGPVLRAFQERYGIRVENFHATGSPLSVRFSSEAAAGRILADVFYTSDTAVYVDHGQQFQTLSAENFPAYGRLPDVARLHGGLAVSHALFSFAFMYNTNKVKSPNIPRTWNELVDPKWKGETLLVDPRSSATYRAAFALARDRVPGILPKIAANAPRLIESATPASQQLAAGTGSIAYINYAAHAVPIMEKGAPIKWATIEEPEITRSAWVGVTKGPHPNAARLFLHYLLTDEGLSIYCKRADDAKSVLDPDGSHTGCGKLAKNAVFLPDTPLSKADNDDVLTQLKLR